MTPRIICPACELKQAPAQRCRRCEAKFSYPSLIAASVDNAELPKIADAERRLILAMMERCDDNAALAARLLGIGNTTLYRKLREYGSCTPGQS